MYKIMLIESEVFGISISVQIPKTSQELETTMGFTNATVIGNDKISTLLLTNSQNPLDTIQSMLKYLSI